jgi:hypothetical protein
MACANCDNTGWKSAEEACDDCRCEASDFVTCSCGLYYYDGGDSDVWSELDGPDVDEMILDSQFPNG